MQYRGHEWEEKFRDEWIFLGFAATLQRITFF